MALEQYVPKTAEEYRVNATAYLVARSSGLSNFKAGSRIRTLIEAIALELAGSDADYYEFYKTAIREACYNAFSFDLKDGNKATGTLRVYHTGHSVDFAIPAFEVTLFGLVYASEPSPTAIPVGQTYSDVSITAERFGENYNVLAGAIDTDLGQGDVDVAFGYDRITNLTDIEGGTEQETEEEREARFQDFINNLARSTLNGIRSGALSVNGVIEAYVTENVNPISGDPETGWIVISISDGSGSPPGSLLTEVAKVIDGDITDPANYPGYRAAGTKPAYVQAIQIEPIDLDIDIDILDSTTLTDPEIETLVSGAIANYVNRLRNGQDVLLQQVSGVALAARRQELIRITFNSPGSDITVADGYVPKIGGTGGGTITVSAINRIAFP